MVGIEPTTSPLSGVRSTTELHAPKVRGRSSTELATHKFGMNFSTTQLHTYHFFNITFYQIFCKLKINLYFY